jgi:hypothetical protein
MRWGQPVLVPEEEPHHLGLSRQTFDMNCIIPEKHHIEFLGVRRLSSSIPRLCKVHAGGHKKETLLAWLTHSTLIYEPKMGGGGGCTLIPKKDTTVSRILK